MRQWKLGEVCEHGSLGRQCLICELTEERDLWKAEAMAARKLARCRQFMAQASHPGGESEMTPDAQEYVRARRASGAAARAAAGEE